jgi:MerR family transcriptional regulator, light-induced transcriptional regulator
MRTLKTSEAAVLLRVSPNTLRAWEERFGYPTPQRSPGGHRLYAYAEIEALREALEEGLSVSSAISAAREGTGADARALMLALASFSASRADSAMESSLQLRTMERSVERLMLPALGELRRRSGAASAVWCFGASWACDWLRRAARLTSDVDRRASILIGDAAGGDLDPTALCLRAFELFCARAGVDVLSLPVSALEGLKAAAASAAPSVIVVAGHAAGDEEVARWAYNVRAYVGSIPMVLYRRGAGTGSNPRRPRPLSATPSEACAELRSIAAAAREREASGEPVGRGRFAASATY